MTETKFKTGDKVIYWSYIGDTGEKKYPIKTEVITSRILGNGKEVCGLKGINGDISAKHLEKI
jgi:hypothetical protein